MRRGIPFFAPMLMALLVPTAARAKPDSCSIEQDNMASQELSRATRLTEIYKISKTFSGCLNDGGTAEEASDDVVVQLSHHWRKSIIELKRYETNRAFISFVLRHIDATTDSDDLRAILTKTKTACPIGARSTCRKVEAAAASALQELKGFGVGA
jgi:hypothetical protein